MPDMEIVKYEAAVEKHCADWMGDVAKLLEQCKAAVKARCRELGQRIANVPVPATTDPKNLTKIPDRINEILTRETSDLKGIVEVQLTTKIDPKTRKLIFDGFSVAGDLTKL
jgi:hypothetical protein